MPVVGDPSKRYYVVAGARTGGISRFSLVEAVPDPLKPDNADKDSRDGPVLIEEDGAAFWAAAKESGFAWVQREFKRHWVWNPGLAAKGGQPH